MRIVQQVFSADPSAIDAVHDLFARLETAAALPLEDFALEVMKLSVHEWIANLIQHADFARHNPSIHLILIPKTDGVQCMIQDNSMGFDFFHQAALQEEYLDEAEVIPARGRGLLMLIACTEDLKYRQLDSTERNQLEFFISRTISFSSTSADLFRSKATFSDPPPLSCTDREAA